VHRLRLRAAGVGCAGCHVRGWTRRGPPNVAPSLLPLPHEPDPKEPPERHLPAHDPEIEPDVLGKEPPGKDPFEDPHVPPFDDPDVPPRIDVTGP
jgi:hypothetical protein